MTQSEMYQLGYAEGKSDAAISFAEKLQRVIETAHEARMPAEYVAGLREALRLFTSAAAIVETELTDAE